MPKVGSTQVKVEALVQAIAREGPSKNGTARSATSPSADKSDVSDLSSQQADPEVSSPRYLRKGVLHREECFHLGEFLINRVFACRI